MLKPKETTEVIKAKPQKRIRYYVTPVNSSYYFTSLPNNHIKRIGICSATFPVLSRDFINFEGINYCVLNAQKVPLLRNY